MTKNEITAAVRRERANLLAVLRGVADDVMMREPVVETWTVRDVLGHISAWYLVAINFLREYRQDGAPKRLGLDDAAAINAFNARAAEERRAWTLERIRREFDETHRELLAEIEQLRDVQLCAQLSPPWPAGVTLTLLIAINSYEHEPEHTEQVKAKSEKPKAESGEQKANAALP